MFYTHGVGHDPAATAAANEASRDARRSVTKVQILEADVERLLMITEALWTILKEQNGFTDDELRERVQAIDMRDGKLDGRVAPSAPDSCAACKRPLARKRPRCIYCGHAAEPSPFAR